MAMAKGDVVLLPFPFDDLSTTKVRPAVCLTAALGRHDHVVVAFITSRVPAPLDSSDLLLAAHDPEFDATGLKVTSVLRLHRLMTVSESLIARRLGSLSPVLQAEVTQRLRQLLDL